MSTWKKSHAVNPFACAARNSAQVGPDLHGDGSTPWRFRIAHTLEGAMNDAHGGQFAVDAAVAPLGILLRQSEHQCSGSLDDGRSTESAVRVGPALGDNVPVPAQQGRRSDEEVPEL